MPVDLDDLELETSGVDLSDLELEPPPPPPPDLARIPTNPMQTAAQSFYAAKQAGMGSPSGGVTSPMLEDTIPRAFDAASAQIGKSAAVVGNIPFNVYNAAARMTGLGAPVTPPFQQGKPVSPALSKLAGQGVQWALSPKDPVTGLSIGDPTGIAAGLGKSAENVVSGLTTPDMLATLPFAQARLARWLFGAQLATTAPETVQKTLATVQSPDKTNAEKWEALGNAGVHLAMLTGIALSLKPSEVKERVSPEKAATVVEPEKVTGATYTDPKTGETTTAPNHVEAAAKQGVEAPATPAARETPEFGFETSAGDVVTRKEAAKVAEDAGQVAAPAPAELHSGDLTPAPEDLEIEPTQPEGGESNASSQQETAAVHGDVRPLEGPSERQVPVQEGGGGVQPQAQGGIQAPPAAPGRPVLLKPKAARKMAEDLLTSTPTLEQMQKTAQSAYHVGAAAIKTPKDLARFRELAQAAEAQGPELLKKQDFAGYGLAAQKKQFYDEAIEAATSDSPTKLALIRKRLGDPDYEPKFAPKAKTVSEVATLGPKKLEHWFNPENPKLNEPFATIGYYEFGLTRGSIPERPDMYSVGMRTAGSKGEFERGGYPGDTNPERAMEKWSVRESESGHGHPTFTHPKAEAIWKAVKESEAKLKTAREAEAETNRQKQAAIDQKLDRYQTEVRAVKLPTGKKTTLEVPTSEGPKVSLKGTQYGQYFLNKDAKSDMYHVTHVNSGLLVGRFDSLNTAKDYIRGLIHAEIPTDFKTAQEVPKATIERMCQVHQTWDLRRKAPDFYEASKTPPVPPASPPSDVGPGMGGALYSGEPQKAQLAQLTDAVKGLKEKPGANATQAFDLGKAVSATKKFGQDSLNGLRAAGTWMKTKLEGRPVITEWNNILGDRHFSLTRSASNVRQFMKDATRQVPDKELQAAISKWVDSGGDENLLKTALATVPDEYKGAYRRALNLTPDQKVFAENLKNYFESRLQEAQDAGILEDGIENYIHRRFEEDSQFKTGILAELRSGLFTGKPALAKRRLFDYDFEAENAGLKPVQSFIHRVAAYDLALNKAIADRAAVKAMMEIKMPDGKPAIDVGGLGTKITDGSGATEATLINPRWKPNDPVNPINDRSQYQTYDHPAFRKWKWVTKDSEGKPIFVQGDVLVHRDFLPQLKRLLDKSKVRESIYGRTALKVGKVVKDTMLDLSGFHQVQITVHGWEHQTFKPVKEIDFEDPNQVGLIKGGLVVGETTGREMFEEGLAGSSLTKFIPYLGPKSVAYREWLFQSYIPRLKMATALHALERNRKSFPKLSEHELNTLTASQMNHAFGELNYAMMGRSATMQDGLRLGMLSPDFTEARAKFVGDAFTKFGAEQRHALLLGAGAIYLTARILNKLITGDAHMEKENAFNLVYNHKAYSLRTIQGDLIHAMTDFPKFVRARLNPVITRPMMEAVGGRDTFGRPRNAGQQAEDFVNTAIPISVKGFFSGREQSAAEALFNSMGVSEHRETPAKEIYNQVAAWKEKNHIRVEPGTFIYDPDKDPYRNLRLAATFYGPKEIKEEMARAEANGAKRSQILKHFRLVGQGAITGKHSDDARFRATLSDADKAKFDQVKKDRHEITQKIIAAGQ